MKWRILEARKQEDPPRTIVNVRVEADPPFEFIAAIEGGKQEVLDQIPDLIAKRMSDDVATLVGATGTLETPAGDDRAAALAVEVS